MSAQEFQDAVMAAKLWLLQGDDTRLVMECRNGVVKALLTKVGGSACEIDFNDAMVFLIRAYRLHQKLLKKD